jgi:hypothetical protein
LILPSLMEDGRLARTAGRGRPAPIEKRRVRVLSGKEFLNTGWRILIRFSCSFHKEISSSTVCSQPGIDFLLRLFHTSSKVSPVQT